MVDHDDAHDAAHDAAPNDPDDDVTVYGTKTDRGTAGQPAGAGGKGTSHGLGAKIKAVANAVTGRDLATGSPEDTEHVRGAGPGGSDGQER